MAEKGTGYFLCNGSTTSSARAELTETAQRSAAEQARRSTAEELIRTFAHDVSNFFLPIGAQVLLLRDRAERGGRPLDKRDAKSVDRAVGQMRQMMTDLLDVTRIEQGLLRIERAPVNLVGIAKECGETLSTPDAPIQVRGEREVVVLADRGSVRRSRT